MAAAKAKTEEKKGRKDKRKHFIPVAGTLIGLCVLIIIVLLTGSISEAMWNSAISDTRDAVGEKRNLVSKEIDQRMTEMRLVLGYADGLFTTRADWYDAFEGVTGYSANSITCKELYYRDSSSKLYNQNGMVIDHAATDIQSVLDSKAITVSRPFYDDTNGWVFAVGYFDENNPNIQQTVGVYTLNEIYADFSFNDDYSASTYVVDKNGEIVLSLQNSVEVTPNDRSIVLDGLAADGISDNFPDMIASAITEQDIILVKQGLNNAYVFSGNAVSKSADWYVVSVLSESVVNARAKDLQNQALIAGAFILGGLLILIVYFILYDMRNRKKMAFAQSYDTIADCSSQAKFEMDAEQIIRTNPSLNYALIYLDIFNYKYVIQLFGFGVENHMIHAFSDAIRKSIKRNEIYGRLNNGRMIILACYKVRDELVEKINDISKKMSSFEPVENSRYRVKVAGGIYCIDPVQSQTLTLAEMIDKAAFAEQSIKDDAGDNFVYYDQRSREALLKVAEVESLMNIALAGKEFKLYLQPKYNIRHDRIDGAESLVRWERPDGIILPDNFIPVFEKNRFIAKLDRYIFEETCKLIAKMTLDGKRALQISVNVSRASAEEEDFLDYYIAIKNKYRIADGFIELEFTESMALESYDFLSQNIDVLRKNGFHTSIDDFGQGYSSFKALKALHFDVMKLDKFFFAQGKDKERDEKLLSGVIELAKSLGMKTIMEGVEEQGELDYLRKMGCDAIQGFIYARPMPKEKFEEFVQKAYEKRVKRGPLGELIENNNEVPDLKQ